MLKRGDTFGSYRIVGRLKAGGMAQLYLARREGAAGFTRPVALKVIHAHLARQDELVRMFKGQTKRAKRRARHLHADKLEWAAQFLLAHRHQRDEFMRLRS